MHDMDNSNTFVGSVLKAQDTMPADQARYGRDYIRN